MTVGPARGAPQGRSRITSHPAASVPLFDVDCYWSQVPVPRWEELVRGLAGIVILALILIGTIIFEGGLK